jgi:hypothetical protein
MAFCLGTPKFAQLGLLQLWDPITSHTNLWMGWGLKQYYSPCWDLSNGMSHTTCTLRKWGDSWLLMVGSQTANLTLGLSFDHNLCFRCPNGWCKPISSIYVSISLQWFKEILELMGFDSCNRTQKIRESIWDSNSQNGSSLVSMRVHALTLFCTHGSTRCDSRASFLACNLTNLCFGCEPKARVMTNL